MRSIFRIDQEDKDLAPFIDLVEGGVLSKSDLSLLTVHTNLLIKHAKEEYMRGYNEGYYEGISKNDKVVNHEGVEE
jgi:hypothetical protein